MKLFLQFAKEIGLQDWSSIGWSHTFFFIHFFLKFTFSPSGNDLP